MCLGVVSRGIGLWEGRMSLGVVSRGLGCGRGRMGVLFNMLMTIIMC